MLFLLFPIIFLVGGVFLELVLAGLTILFIDLIDKLDNIRQKHKKYSNMKVIGSACQGVLIRMFDEGWVDQEMRDEVLHMDLQAQEEFIRQQQALLNQQQLLQMMEWQQTQTFQNTMMEQQMNDSYVAQNMATGIEFGGWNPDPNLNPGMDFGGNFDYGGGMDFGNMGF